MKNLSILSIALLVSAPTMAMEGQWNKEKTEAPVEEHKQSKVPSLANLCLNTLETQGVIEDPQFLLDLPHKIGLLGERYATLVWKNATQEIIDAFDNELVEQLFNPDYPVTTKAIIAERLTLTETQAQKLFESVIDSNNEQPNKYLIARALFAKYKDLQTWENGQKVAELGPITYEAAKAIVKTIKTIGKLYALCQEMKKFGLPDQMLNFGNEQVFEQAFYDLCLSKPISIANQPPASPIETFNFNSSYKLTSCSYPIEFEEFKAVDHIASNSKYLQSIMGNFVCYLPKSTRHIAVSYDKKWCVCCDKRGTLTIINLPRKSIVATMHGRFEFAQEGIYFGGNNQLFSHGTLIKLPYSYLENSMDLATVISVILQKNNLQLPNEGDFYCRGGHLRITPEEAQKSILVEDLV